jgi:hypothetical protein
MVRDGKLYKRYEVKAGGKPPMNFEAANEVDEVTGKQQGWVPVGDGPDDRWHREAFERPMIVRPQDGTYELCGPKVQGNPERFEVHIMLRHGMEIIDDCPRTFDGLKAWFASRDIEGIVWHHADGRMVKIKKKDFGLLRKPAIER